MRICSFLTVFAVLSACGGPVQPQATEGADVIECALGEGSDFGPHCRAERVRVEGEEQLVLRHPDGGFRRLAVLPDGAGVSAADGADAVVQQLDGGVLEVTIAADRYRIPAVSNAATE
jgi:hypothetical protein